MDEVLMRMLLELPLREHLRRQHRCPPTRDDPRLSELQADLVEGVIRETLDALELSDERHEHGLTIAADALRRAAGEDRHDDPIVPSDGGYQKAVSYQR